MPIYPKLRIIVFSIFSSLVLYLPAYSQPFAYITDYFGSENVCVVDLLTNTEVAVIPVNCISCEPYWIAVSSSQNLVAASLHTDDGVALIDPETMTHIGNVAGVGSEPEAVAVNSTGTLVYVADEALANLYVVDVATQKVISPSPIDVSVLCNEPENMVISPDDSALYITCAGDEVISVDTTTFAQFQIAKNLSDPHGIAIDSTGTLLYYTDGTDVFEYSIPGGVNTGTTFLGCDMYNGALSPNDDRLYCVDEGNELFIYSTSTGNLIQTVNLSGSTAWGVAVSPDGARAFVPIGSTLNVVDATTFALSEIDLTCTDARGIVIVQEILPPPPPVIGQIPTINEVGAVVLVLLLGLVSVYWFRLRKRTS